MNDAVGFEGITMRCSRECSRLRAERPSRRAVCASCEANFRCSRRTSGMSDQQRPLGDDQIGQPEQAEQLCLVLRQALVAGLPVTKQVLDHVERMLDLGPDARLQLLGLLEQARPLASGRVAGACPAASLRATADLALPRACARRDTQRRRRLPSPRRAAARQLASRH